MMNIKKYVDDGVVTKDLQKIYESIDTNREIINNSLVDIKKCIQEKYNSNVCLTEISEAKYILRVKMKYKQELSQPKIDKYLKDIGNIIRDSFVDINPDVVDHVVSITITNDVIFIGTK